MPQIQGGLKQRMAISEELDMTKRYGGSEYNVDYIHWGFDQ